MKNFIKISACVFCLMMLGRANAIFAASGDFNFVLGEKKFSANQETASSWLASQTIEPQNILAPGAEPIKNSVLKFIGQPAASQNFSRIYNYNLSAIYNHIEELAKTINIPVINPALQIQDNSRVVEFTPPQAGLEVDIYKSAFEALMALQMDKAQSELSVNTTEPRYPLAQTNSLGINELIAQGVSSFKGSPNNRRHNIRVGVEKFKGLIIAQGEEFSFNKYLGPVEKENGFLPELVIKKTGTVPELGGGLCQVSSTTFRAAMAAGLPIIQRKNHAYAVQYYSPQGTDATIYPGSVDLKFVNDTPGAILVWPYIKDKDTLIFDFYGTKDSRQVTLEKPVQYDHKTDGSMKATWTRLVTTASGQQRTDVFKSVYASPALFHKEEKFIASPTTTPASNADPNQIQ